MSRGNGINWETLCVSMRPRLQCVAGRVLGDEHEAEDVTQEALLAAWRGADRLRDPGAIEGWLCRVARTRERFGTPREEVEAMIAASWGASAQPTPPSPVSSAPSPRQAPTRPPTPQHVDPPQPAPAAASSASPSSAPRPPTPAAPPTRVVPEPATPGRGGPQHKYLQSLIASHAQNNGFLATIEAEVGQGGRIDVLLVRSDLRIAVEISITTSPDHEIGNLKKCLDSAVDQVVVVSPTPSVLKRIREQAKAALPAFQFERVRFLSPEEFVTSLQPLPEPPSPTVRGYKVKTTVKTSDPDAAASSKQSIAKTISDALRRLKKD